MLILAEEVVKFNSLLIANLLTFGSKSDVTFRGSNTTFEVLNFKLIMLKLRKSLSDTEICKSLSENEKVQLEGRISPNTLAKITVLDLLCHLQFKPDSALTKVDNDLKDSIVAYLGKTDS